MRKKHEKHNRFGAFIIILVLAACMAVGCSAVSKDNIEDLTGKDTAQKLEKIKKKAEKAADKAGKAAGKTEEAAKKVKKYADKVIEKAGGPEAIANKVTNIIGQFAKKSRLKSRDDIELTSLDNTGYAYRFTYGRENYRAIYTASCDTWTIYDSYKITNEHDITLICQALIDEHPVHGKDLKSYRTAEDMAYEWQQHNIMYELLPDDSRWKSSAKHVDLDPYDQGKSYKDIYEDRTGKEFDLKNFV